MYVKSQVFSSLKSSYWLKGHSEYYFLVSIFNECVNFQRSEGVNCQLIFSWKMNGRVIFQWGLFTTLHRNKHIHCKYKTLNGIKIMFLLLFENTDYQTMCANQKTEIVSAHYLPVYQPVALGLSSSSARTEEVNSSDVVHCKNYEII